MKRYLVFFLFLIFIVGCSPEKFITYQPKTTENTDVLYSNGVPVASSNLGPYKIMLSAEESKLLGDTYLMLWVYFENNDSTAFLLEPYKLIKVEVFAEGHKYGELYPESPTKILDRLEKEESAERFAESLGGTLQYFATGNTVATTSRGDQIVINDADQKREEVSDRTDKNLDRIEKKYGQLKTDFNDGALRKNTVLPGQSVNGMVYLAIKNIYIPDEKSNTISFNKYTSKYEATSRNKIELMNFRIYFQIEGTEQYIDIEPTKVW